MLKTLKETLEYYGRLYQSAKPDDNTFNEISELWNSWETVELKRPDIGKIIAENNFTINLFKEIVDFIDLDQRRIAYQPFILKDYNYRAFTASDGYIILADEKLDSLLDLFDNSVEPKVRVVSQVLQNTAYFAVS